MLYASKDGVAVHEENHDFQLYGQISLAAISKDPLVIIQGNKKYQYLYFSKIHHLVQEKDVGSACHFNIIGLTSVYHFKVDVSVDYICWMHVLTTQSYLTDVLEDQPPTSNADLEKIVFENHSQTYDRTKIQLRQETTSWDLRRNSSSSLKNNWKFVSESKSKYASPPLSLVSSGVEESKSAVSNASSGLASHLQKRWSTDIPIKPVEWQKNDL